MSNKNYDKNANVNNVVENIVANYNVAINNVAKNKNRFIRRNTIAGFGEEDGHIGPSLHGINMLFFLCGGRG